LLASVTALKTAASWERVNDEINWPKPVVATTFTNVPINRVRKGPLIGTRKTKVAIKNRKAKFTMAMPTYGSCLSNRNSNLVIGVERKLAIERFSFSWTSAMADRWQG
jgi:hypothetical protein